MKKKKPDTTKGEIVDLKKKLAVAEAGWKRALADYQNLEKRLAKERAEIVRLANTILIAKFLTILDDLERAGEHAPDEGLDLILKQFHSILNSEGVKEIKAKGQHFDPYRMECVGTVKDRACENEKVVEVTKKGYLYSDGQGFEQIIRPAEVIVNRRKEK